MSRLVVVSNRVAPVGEGETVIGGLAVAVLAALRETGGIWFGWSGETAEQRPARPSLNVQDNLTIATVDLTERDVDEYYNGFSNGALWPLLHYRLDLSRFHRHDYLGYMRVNDWLARKLLDLLEPGDTIWVHDYHLIPLARILRQMGSANRIGFFSHTPFPPTDLFVALPWHKALLQAFCDYDLVGFQTEHDLASFHDCVQTASGGNVADDGTIEAFGRRTRAGVFPIGIDTDNVRRLAAKHNRSRIYRRLKEVLHERSMIVGVDRLDYSKGLIDRFQAYGKLLELYGNLRGKVTLMQVAPPSRADVYGYDEIRAELENLTGQHQRPVRGFRLGAGALPQPQLRARHAYLLLPRGGGRTGDAAARRDESCGQRIRSIAEPGTSGRTRAVAVRRRSRGHEGGSDR